MIFKMWRNRKILESEMYLILIPIAGFIQLLHTQLIVYIFPEAYYVVTNFIVAVYMIAEYVCLLFFILMKMNIPFKKSLLSAISLPLTIGFGSIVDINYLERWSFTYVMIETIILIIGSLFLVSKLTLDDTVKKLNRNSDFLIVSAILFTFSYFAPFYAIRNILLKNIDIYIQIQTLVIILGYCIFYTLLTQAIIWKIKLSKY
jgi:hypothetical protein